MNTYNYYKPSFIYIYIYNVVGDLKHLLMGIDLKIWKMISSYYKNLRTSTLFKHNIKTYDNV